MSKKKRQKKGAPPSVSSKKTVGKVVKTKKEQVLKPTRARTTSKSNSQVSSVPLLFGKKNFMFIFIGMACMALGMLLMSGGHMPSPDVWDESIIYGFRRITLAPIMILLGLGCVLYSIFAPNRANA